MDIATRTEFTTLMTWTGPRTHGLGRLLSEYPSPSAALQADTQRLAELPRSTQRVLHEARRHWPRPRPGAASFERPGVTYIPLNDPRYPELLKATPDPPPWLFCRGDHDCLRKPAVAIVGSRRASHAGLSAASQLAEQLATAGYTICSGLALGIDAAAHQGALQGGRTAAVLASGIDRASPHCHLELARRISVQGCVLTELPPGTPPSKAQFPRRNRIISGLASATIIVEAALPSGSLHTAAAALEQGRDVFVLPWSVFHRQGSGCLRLLRDGATPITDLNELAQFFPRVSEPVSAMQLPLAPLSITPSSSRPSGPAGNLLRLIGDSALSPETLVRDSGIPLGHLLVLLGELEVDGWLQRLDGAYSRHPGKT